MYFHPPPPPPLFPTFVDRIRDSTNTYISGIPPQVNRIEVRQGIQRLIDYEFSRFHIEGFAIDSLNINGFHSFVSFNDIVTHPHRPEYERIARQTLRNTLIRESTRRNGLDIILFGRRCNIQFHYPNTGAGRNHNQRHSNVPTRQSNDQQTVEDIHQQNKKLERELALKNQELLTKQIKEVDIKLNHKRQIQEGLITQTSSQTVTTPQSKSSIYNTTSNSSKSFISSLSGTTVKSKSSSNTTNNVRITVCMFPFPMSTQEMVETNRDLREIKRDVEVPLPQSDIITISDYDMEELLQVRMVNDHHVNLVLRW